ncbi:hypothetical protein [Chitinimonas sp.]|uniref:J domain-containing protein n=1 Tax=Chitinimonas sp. TaxID=1934313 RepID=UPI002F95CC68
MKLLTLFVFGLLGYWVISWLLETLNKSKAKTPPLRQVAALPGTTAADAQLARYCDELGLARPFNHAALQAAYHGKLAQYEPGRASGLAPDLQALAEERLAAIKVAYEMLLPHAVE